MKLRPYCLPYALSLALGWVTSSQAAEPASVLQPFTFYSTNGPAVFSNYVSIYTNRSAPPRGPRFTNDAAGKRWLVIGPRLDPQTNSAFHTYVPGSFGHSLFTNLLARTNGRSPLIWSERTHPPKWPGQAPVLKWNRDSLVYGMTGLTALSPCWEMEGNPGQVPITALTRRHGYTRGHSMGEGGFRKHFAGRRVWFLAADDEVVEVKVRREVVRPPTLAGGRDYTLLFFDRDLPPEIRPIRVARGNVFAKLGTGALAFSAPVPIPMLLVEQGGNVSAGLPGFTFETRKGGDSGSANLLAIGEELVFCGGRATSQPSREMQEDMDELSREAGLDPAKYQMQWRDLSEFPDY